MSTFKARLHKKPAALKIINTNLAFPITFSIFFALDTPSQTFLGSIYHLEKHTQSRVTRK
jgi:hypothetical protein